MGRKKNNIETISPLRLEKNKALEGLKGLNELPYDNQKAWIAVQKEKKTLSPNAGFNEADRLYRNGQFIDKFDDIQLFKSLTPKERDALYEDTIVNELFTDVFKNNDNFEFLSTLTTQGKKDMLKTIKSDDDIEQIRKDEEKYKTDLAKSTKIWDVITKAAYSNLGGPIGNSPLLNDIEKKIGAIERINNTRFQEIVDEDNLRVRSEAIPLTNDLYEGWNKAIARGTVTEDSFDKAFEEIAGGYSATIDTEFGPTVKEMPGSNYYKAFKDADELKDLTISDKMKLSAEYAAVSKLYGEDKAVSVLDSHIRDIVSENQTAGDWALSTWNNVKLGGLANIMNEVVALRTIGLYSEYLATGDPSKLYNYLNGKDKDGNPLANWINPQYWKGVDAYNTMDINEINRANENGGVSANQRITKTGEDLDFFSWNTLNAAIEQSKYIWSEALKSYVFAGIGKGVSSIAGAKFSKNILSPSSQIVKELSSKVGNFNNTFMSVGNVARSTLAMSESEALGTASELDLKLKEESLDEARKLAGEYAEKELNKPENLDRIHEATMDQYNKMLKKYPNVDPGKIDIEGIYNNQIETFKSIAYNNYLDSNQFEAEPSYQKKEDLRKDAVLLTYGSNFAVQAVKEGANNLSFRSFLFDKGTREALSLRQGISKKRTADGLLQAAAPKSKGRIIGEQVVGNFADEFLDGITHSFAEGFGMNNYNNYIAGMNNPKSTDHDINALNFIQQINSGLSEIPNALADKQNYYEAFIGAISPFMPGISPQVLNPGTYTHFKTDSEGRKLSKLERINRIIFNPIAQEIINEEDSQRSNREKVNILNKVILDNRKAFEHLRRVLTTIDYKKDAIKSGETIRVKDAKELEAFELAYALENAAGNEFLREDEDVETINKLIDDLSDGNIPDEIVSQFLADGNNKSVNREKDPKAVARERIQKNAIKIHNIREEIREANKKINSNKNSRNAPDDIKKQLVFNETKKFLLNDRITAMEEEISGRHNINVTESRTLNASARIGSTKGYEAALFSHDEEISKLEKEIKGLKESLKPVKKLKEPRLYTAIKFDIKGKEQTLDKLKSERTKILNSKDSIGENGFTETLSADEIINLSPKDRAFILSPSNKGIYSKEQQEQIEIAKSKLLSEDPNSLEKVRDVAALINQRDSFIDLSNKILSNPEEALAYSEGVQESYRRGIVKQVQENIFRTWDEIFNKVDPNNLNDLWFDEKNDKTPVSQNYLERYKKIVQKQMENGEITDGVERLSAINNAIGKLEILGDIKNAIDHTVKDSSQRAVWYSQVSKVIKESENASAIMDNLERDVLNADESSRDTYNKILDAMANFGHLRNATVQKDVNEEINKRKNEEILRKEKERLKDGKNFFWDGYVIGDEVYHQKTGIKGKVLKFEIYDKDDSQGLMSVKFEDGSEIYFNSNKDKDLISKNPPKNKPEAPAKPVDSGVETPSGQMISGDSGTNYEGVNLEEEGKPVENKITLQALPKRRIVNVKYSPNGNIYSFRSNLPFNPGDKVKIPGVTTEVTVVEVTNDTTTTQIGDIVLKELEPITINGKTVEVVPYESNDSLEGDSFGSDEGVIQVTSGDSDGSDIAEEYTENETYNIFVGSRFREYDTKVLKEEGRLVPTVSESKNGDYDYIINFLKAHNIKLQKIVDNCVAKMFKRNPNLKIHYGIFDENTVCPEDGRIWGKRISSLVGMFVEATDEVLKDYNTEYGNPIEFNGKKYILIGTLGYPKKASDTINAEFWKIRNTVHNDRSNANMSGLYIDNNLYTTILGTSPGRRVRQLPGDTEVKDRSLKELLFNAGGTINTERNPEGLDYEDLVFAILKGKEFKLLSTLDDESYSPPRDYDKNNGSLFLMVKAANGKYIPIRMNVAKYNNLKGSKVKDKINLKDEINQAFLDIASTDFEKRKEAMRKLKTMILFTKDANIRIDSTEGAKRTKVIFSRNGVEKEFILDSSFDLNAYNQAIEEMDFSVNITVSALKTRYSIKKYDDAGALTTDVAYLGTMNMAFYVNRLDDNMKPMNEKYEAIITNKPYDLNAPTTIKFENKLFSRDSNRTYKNEKGETITNEATIKKLDILMKIKESSLPVTKAVGTYKYYIVPNSDGSKSVVTVDSKFNVSILSEQESNSFIADLEKQAAEQSKAEAAKKELEAAKQRGIDGDFRPDGAGTQVTGAIEDIPIDGKTVEETNLQQMQGNFGQEPQTPAQVPPAPKPIASTEGPKTVIGGKENINILKRKEGEPLDIPNKKYNFEDEYGKWGDNPFRDKFDDIIEEKGWDVPSDFDGMIKFLNDKGVETTEITDLDMWLEHLKECIN